MNWLTALRHAWQLWKATDKQETLAVIHDCRPIGIPPGSTTGRLECRICHKRIGRHEQVDQYGNWQHPRESRFDYGPGGLLAPGQTATVNMADVGITQSVSDLGWLATQYRRVQRGEITRQEFMALIPFEPGGHIGEYGGVPIVTDKHSRNGI